MLSLKSCQKIISAVHAKGAALGLKPLSIVVLDAGGHVLAFERADGASAGRFEIARGKAYGCVMLGLGGSAIQSRGETQAVFVDAMNGIYDGKFVPVKGGVLVLDAGGKLMGAIGVTGDTSDNDTICAMAGVEAVGLIGIA